MPQEPALLTGEAMDGEAAGSIERAQARRAILFGTGDAGQVDPQLTCLGAPP